MLRRRWTAGEGTAADLGLIITPMLDMAFQLLAFFIMTYRPPAREATLDDTLLPAGTQTAAASAKHQPNQKRNPKDSLSLQIVVHALPGPKTQAQAFAPGPPREIMLYKPGQRDPSFRAEIKPPVDFEMALNKLVAELNRSRVNPAEKDWQLDIAADRGLKFMYVARLRDVLAPLGFQRIGLNEPAPH
jgi:biopolymer transport protein ExbD